MACGDRYRHLIRTRTGLTDAEPYGLIPDGNDVIDWADASRDLLAQVEKRYQLLVQYETGAGEAKPPANPVYPSIKPDLDAYRTEVQEFPGFWSTLGIWPTEWKTTIDRIRANMADGVCLLDRIDAAISDTGVDPPGLPSAPTPGKTTTEKAGDAFASAVATVAIGGLVGGSLWVAYKLATRK